MVRVIVGVRVKVRFRSEICSLPMCNFEIVQCIVQIMQIDILLRVTDKVI